MGRKRPPAIAGSTESLRCSFCLSNRKNAKLIASSNPSPDRAYICDQCVLVCYAILRDDGAIPENWESNGFPSDS